jgi:hypothetical protein
MKSFSFRVVAMRKTVEQWLDYVDEVGSEKISSPSEIGFYMQWKLLSNADKLLKPPFRQAGIPRKKKIEMKYCGPKKVRRKLVPTRTRAMTEEEKE